MDGDNVNVGNGGGFGTVPVILGFCGEKDLRGVAWALGIECLRGDDLCLDLYGVSSESVSES